MVLVNDAVLLKPVGTGAMRADRMATWSMRGRSKQLVATDERTEQHEKRRGDNDEPKQRETTEGHEGHEGHGHGR